MKPVTEPAATVGDPLEGGREGGPVGAGSKSVGLYEKFRVDRVDGSSEAGGDADV